MFPLRFATFFAAFLAATCAAAPPSNPPIVAELSLAQGGEVRLAYRLSPDAAVALRFPTPREDLHRIVRSAGWKHDEKCFALTQASITLARDAACASAYVRLDWDDRPVDRMYPAVVRLRNGGVLVFADYIQVLTEDGEHIAPIRLVAPPGSVAVFRDAKSSSELLVDGTAFGDDGRGWLYLGPDTFVEEAVARMLVDEGVPALARAQVLELAPRLLRFYGERLGRIDQRPTFWLTWSARDDPSENWQADVVPGEVRFGLRGRGWADDPPRSMDSFRNTIAHELAHFWNGADAHRPAFTTPWLSEGSAELFAAAGLLHEGAIDAREAAGKLETAATDCLLLAGSRSWVDFPGKDRGRVPYACGFLMQFAIVAAASQGPTQVDPFSLWSGIWREWPQYYEASLTQFFRRHGDPELADLLQAMLIRKDIPLDSAVQKLLARAKIAPGARRSMSPATISAAAGAVMAAMMAADCNRSVSFNRRADHVEIVDLPCKTFRPGMRIAFVEGHDLYVEPFAAAAAARKACVEGRRVALKGREGDAIEVACESYTAAEIPSDAALMQFDPGDVRRLLLGR